MSTVWFGPKHERTDDVCVICQDDLFTVDGRVKRSNMDTVEHATGITVLPCGHENHTACLKRWERKQATCPECREPFPRFLNPIVAPLAPVVPAPVAPAPGSIALMQAAEFGRIQDVDRLLQVPGVDATALNNYLIRVAARNGHLDVVERLLQVPGVDATALNNEAIRWAARYGHLAVVERLLQVPGVDATANNNEARRWAAGNGHRAVVERLQRWAAENGPAPVAPAPVRRV
jgi:hypothetical protein